MPLWCFPNYRIFTINPSRYIARLADEGKTIFDLFEMGGLHR